MILSCYVWVLIRTFKYLLWYVIGFHMVIFFCCCWNRWGASCIFDIKMFMTCDCYMFITLSIFFNCFFLWFSNWFKINILRNDEINNITQKRLQYLLLTFKGMCTILQWLVGYYVFDRVIILSSCFIFVLPFVNRKT